ncbi:hypothetical protein [Micromonospora sp. NBC_00617]|uniref:hypothetical protein n=1 Tax=Micromonospora sp. NBC_00617 TaxID=2903587 RepID=UPI0030DF34D8
MPTIAHTSSSLVRDTEPDGRTTGAPPAHRRWRTRLTAMAVGLTAALTLVGLASPAQAATSRQEAHQSLAAAAAAARPDMAVTPLAYPRGYVTEGNLRRNPNLGAERILTIYNQWVEISCWIDGGPNGFGSNRWFKAHYYSQVGYLSSGVVSSQPSVGAC